MATNLKAFLKHTAAYYKMQFTPQKVSTVAAYAMLTAAAAVGASVVTARAGVAKWELTDVFNQDVYESAGIFYALEDDVPEMAEQQFHLQMPTSLEGYLSESTYSSGDTPDPEHPKLDEMVGMTTDPSYFATYKFELPTDEEWAENEDGFTEFLENRPPKSGLE